MSGYEKKPCPHCGEEVSTHPRWWKEHIAKHDVPEIKEEKPEVTATKTETPKAEKAGGPSEELMAKMRPEEKELMERALAKQKENAVAPNISAITGSADENMELRKLYAPETIEERDPSGKITKPAERHAFIADGKNLRMYVDRGYVPVLNGQGEFVRTPHGDVLCTQDMATHKAIESAVEKENLKRERTKAAAVKRAALDADGGGAGDEIKKGEASLDVAVTTEQVPWTS